MGLSAINVCVVSGYIAGAVVEDRSRGVMASFDLVMDSEFQDGARYMATVPILAYGKRAERCLQLRPKTRLCVQGELVEHNGKLAVFSNWIEYVTTGGGRKPVASGGLADLLEGAGDD
jgi:hypothetical protein